MILSLIKQHRTVQIICKTTGLEMKCLKCFCLFVCLLVCIKSMCIIQSIDGLVYLVSLSPCPLLQCCRLAYDTLTVWLLSDIYFEVQIISVHFTLMLIISVL